MGGSGYVAKNPGTPGVKRNVGIILKKIAQGPQGPIIKKGTKKVVTFGGPAKKASKLSQPIASAFSGAGVVRNLRRTLRAADANPPVKNTVARVRKPAPPVAVKKVLRAKRV